jgi:hypothetical protein
VDPVVNNSKDTPHPTEPLQGIHADSTAIPNEAVSHWGTLGNDNDTVVAVDGKMNPVEFE